MSCHASRKGLISPNETVSDGGAQNVTGYRSVFYKEISMIRYVEKYAGLLMIFLLLPGLLACAGSPAHRQVTEVPAAGGSGLSELLESNYDRADLVVGVEITSLAVEKEIRADSGETGYVVTRESGIVSEVYKGDVQPGTEITYNDWAEYSPSWKNNRKGVLLVFLKKDRKSKVYRTIGEGSVFTLSPEIKTFMRSLRRN